MKNNGSRLVFEIVMNVRERNEVILYNIQGVT